MNFVIRRIAFYLVAFLVAATINFALPRLMPGNPIDVMFAQQNSTLTPEARNALIETFGFASGPLHQQFFDYMKSVFTGDLGYSIRFYPQKVNQVLAYALPWTLLLAGTATLLAFCVGSVIGTFAAWRRGGMFDAVVTPVSLALQATPAVVIALTALFIFGVALKWLPTGYAFAPALDPAWSFEFFGSVALHGLMPICSLMIVFVGGYLVTMRNNMIGQLGEDHAARNALLPSVTSLGLTLGAILGGSLVTEVVFNYPGLGQTLYIGIVTRDYPLIQGQLLIMTFATLLANLAVDLLYVFLDPRLRKA
jgi:peptide/nickel transport system permease protein